MCKRLWMIVIIFALSLSAVSAQSQYSATLSRIEKSLFGIDYGTQNDDARLKRIEEVVYGQASSGTESQRVGKLSKDLSADLMGQEIKPKTDTFAQDDDDIKEDIPKEDKSVDYPIVNNLEDKVFHKEFKGTDINQRLANLETNVFRKTYNDDLNSRVERLKTAVIPERTASSSSDDESDGTYDDNSYTGQRNSSENGLNQKDFSMLPQNQIAGEDTGAASAIPTYNSQNSVLNRYQGNSDIVIPLAAVEKNVLKRSYPNEAIPNRLSRLEMLMFNSTFDDDDAQTRMERISTAYQAQKSSAKYDNNKFTQHMSTAMQIGAILLMILAAVL